MDIFEIKEEYKTAIVGFNNSGLPLGERKDLDKLAAMAHYSPGLQKYFVQLPTLEQIEEYQAGKFLNENPAPAVPESQNVRETVEPVAPAPQNVRNSAKNDAATAAGDSQTDTTLPAQAE